MSKYTCGDDLEYWFEKHDDTHLSDRYRLRPEVFESSSEKTRTHGVEETDSYKHGTHEETAQSSLISDDADENQCSYTVGDEESKPSMESWSPLHDTRGDRECECDRQCDPLSDTKRKRKFTIIESKYYSDKCKDRPENKEFSYLFSEKKPS